jgi:rare lipoprotein A
MLNCPITGFKLAERNLKEMLWQSIQLKNTALGVAVAISLWLSGSVGQATTTATASPALEEKTKTAESAAKEGTASFSGNISWYGIPFHGKPTASGEIFDMYKFSAAHLHLPFGTKVLVEDPRTGNTVMVKVNDRGPFVKTRVMDVSKGAATKLGTISRGVSYVDCVVIGKSGT